MQKDGTFFINEFFDSVVDFFRSRYARIAQRIIVDLVSSEFLCLLQSVGEEFADDAWRGAIAIILFIYHSCSPLYNEYYMFKAGKTFTFTIIILAQCLVPECIYFSGGPVMLK